MSEPGLFSCVSMVTGSFSLMTSVSCIRSEHWFQFSVETHTRFLSRPLLLSSSSPLRLFPPAYIYVYSFVESFVAGCGVFILPRNWPLNENSSCWWKISRRRLHDRERKAFWFFEWWCYYYIKFQLFVVFFIIRYQINTNICAYFSMTQLLVITRGLLSVCIVKLMTSIVDIGHLSWHSDVN